jgi:hypothetical protein
MSSRKNHVVDSIKDNGERNEREGRGGLWVKMKRTERATERGKVKDIEDNAGEKERG